MEHSVINEIKISRALPVLRERVFEAWSDPDLLKLWLNPFNTYVNIDAIDPKIDGKIYLLFKDSDKKSVATLAGKYTDYIFNEKLKIQCRIQVDFFSENNLECAFDIDFYKIQSGTKLVICQKDHFNEEFKIISENEWGKLLDRLYTILVHPELDNSNFPDYS